MRITSIPQIYRHVNRWREIASVLSKYGLAGWIGRLGPDFAKVAEAYGITGLTVREKSEVESVLAQAAASAGPVLIDFIVEQEENVYPMVAPGASVGNMLRRPVAEAA